MPEYIIELGKALYDPDAGAAVFKPEFRGELVRCRECKHSKEYDDGGIWCERLTGVFKVDHDGFCKWGKKNDD